MNEDLITALQAGFIGACLQNSSGMQPKSGTPFSSLAVSFVPLMAKARWFSDNFLPVVGEIVVSARIDDIPANYRLDTRFLFSPVAWFGQF